MTTLHKDIYCLIQGSFIIYGRGSPGPGGHTDKAAVIELSC